MKKPDDGKLRFITLIPTYALYFQNKVSLASSLLNRPNPGHNILEQVLGSTPKVYVLEVSTMDIPHGYYLHFPLNSIYN